MALSKKPPSSQELQAALQACLGKRDYKGAVSAFEALLKQGSPSSQLRMRYADTLMLAGRKGDAVREYLHVAEEMAESGYLVQAVAVFKKIVKLDPTKKDVLARLAHLDAERSASVVTTARPPAAATAPSASGFDGAGGDEMQDLDIGLELGIRPFAPASPVAPAATPAPPPEPVRAAPAAELSDDLSLDDLEPDLPEAPALPAPALPVGAPASPEARPTPAFEFAPPAAAAAPAFSFEFAAPAATTVPEPVVSASAPVAPAAPEDADLGFLSDDLDALLDGIQADVASSSAAAPVALGKVDTHIGLFAHLAVDELVEVLKLLEWQTVAAGEAIVREGEPGNSMYIISSGSVEASVSKNGVETRIATLEEGNFFGEMAVLGGGRRSATVIARESSEILELSQERLLQLFSRHPEVEAKLRLAHEERLERNRQRG